MKLSIISGNYNTKDITEAFLDSLYKYKPNCSFEVIIVDDGSSDGSVEMLQRYAKLKRFHLILNKQNKGYVKVNNQGLRVSKGEYKLLINNDTILHLGAIDKLLNFCENTKDCGVVGPKLLNTDGSLQFSCYRFPTIRNAILENFFGKKGLFDKYSPLGNEPQVVDSLVGAVFMISKRAYKVVGMLNKRFKAYYEDMDYCRRVWRHGFKVYYYPKAIVTHHHGVSFARLADSGEQWKKLIPSSIIYHGRLKHYLIFLITWVGQKWQKLLR